MAAIERDQGGMGWQTGAKGSWAGPHWPGAWSPQHTTASCPAKATALPRNPLPTQAAAAEELASSTAAQLDQERALHAQLLAGKEAEARGEAERAARQYQVTGCGGCVIDSAVAPCARPRVNPAPASHPLPHSPFLPKGRGQQGTRRARAHRGGAPVRCAPAGPGAHAAGPTAGCGSPGAARGEAGRRGAGPIRR